MKVKSYSMEASCYKTPLHDRIELGKIINQIRNDFIEHTFSINYLSSIMFIFRNKQIISSSKNYEILI